MKINLYDYQLSTHEANKQMFKDGHRRIINAGCPRIGKGTIIAYQCVEAAKNGAQVLVIVHKRELIFEIQKRLREQMGASCGIIMAGEPMQPNKRIQLMSVATGLRRIAKLKWLNPALIIGDECHRMLSAGQMKIINEHYPNARVIGYSATPFRNDKKRFDEAGFTALHQITSFQAQIERRVLVPSITYHPDVSVSLDGVRIRVTSEGMDFDQGQLSDRYSDIEVLEGLYKLWMRKTGGRLQTMAFNVDKKNNNTVVAYFRSKGVNAVAVDEGTPMDCNKIDKHGNPVGRKQILEKFYKGPFCENPIMYLGNISLFGEGIDCPSVKCVIANYASLSLSKVIQTTARGSGAMFGPDKKWLIDPRTGRNYKDKVIILDMGNNFIRHKVTLDTYDQFGFDLSGKQKPQREAPTRECPECHVLISINCRNCPECGAELPIKPKNSKEDLKELSTMVDFKVLDQDQVTVQRMLDNLKDDASVVKFCHIAWLRINALVNRKGDPVDYARRIILEKYAADPQMCLDAINNGHSHKLDGKMLREITGDRKKLEEFLEKREKRHMTFDRFERFKKNMLRL